jgi:hypothetical protein
MDTEPEKSKSLEYTLGILILLGSIAAIFIWHDARMQKRGRGHEQVRAHSNLRQIGLALFEFDIEYGQFPSPKTRPLVEKDFGTAIDLSGNSSNALFRQLFAVEFTQSEQMFYARIPGIHKSDGYITPGSILQPGECGFSYITNLSSKDDTLSPIVLTPLIPGTTKFDPKPFDGKAVILHIDNSVRTYDIHKDGHVYDKGINLLSAKHPVWKGKAPDIRYPDL